LPVTECGESVPLTENLSSFRQFYNSNPEKESKFRAKKDYYLETSWDGFSPRRSQYVLSRVWQCLISEYSQLKLTFPSEDFLVAIAGIAQLMKELMEAVQEGGVCKARYASGLWLHNIHDELLWDIYLSTDDSNCGAPSWSWASQLGQVFWPESTLSSPVPALKVTHIIQQDGTRYVNEYESAHLGDRVANTPNIEGINNTRNTTINTINPITTLVVNARLRFILIGDHFTEVSNSEAQAKTGMPLYNVIANLYYGVDGNAKESEYYYRAVHHPNDLETIRGWASINRPEARMQFGDYERNMVEAMLVSVNSNEDISRIEKLFSSRRLVANVLFVARCGVRQYRRIGMGMIFDVKMVEEWRKAETVEIQLV
jgi:hypothetical protein